MVAPDSRTRDWLGLAAWIAVTFAAAAIGSRFEPGQWYAALDKPAWTPPSSVFAPVWTVLYLFMAIAAWLVWRRVSLRSLPIAVFLLQLALNTAWSWLFFGEHRIALALADIVTLWVAIALTILLFRRHSTAAALLLVPYLLWVSYATALNYALWRLNG